MKNLSLYSLSKRQALAKTQAFKKTNYLWNRLRCNAIPFNGKTMELVQVFKPATRKEWEDKYLDYRKQHFNEEYLFSPFLKNFASSAHISTELAFNYAYIRIIDQTYDGYLSELRAMEVLRMQTQIKHPNEHYVIQHATSYVDRNMGIDLEVFKEVNGTLQRVAGIQLKPSSYISTAPWTKDAYSRNYNIQMRYASQFHCPVYYAFYEELNDNQRPHLFIDGQCNCRLPFFAGTQLKQVA